MSGNNATPRPRSLRCWYAPGMPAQSFDDIIPPKWFQEAAATGGPWHKWPPEAQVYIRQENCRVSVYSLLRGSNSVTSSQRARVDHPGWFTTTKPGNGKHFVTELRNAVLQCERCSRIYDQNLRLLERSGGRPILQLSFAFCPLNSVNQCNGRVNGEWIETLLDIEKLFEDVARETMTTLSKLNPDKLVKYVFRATEFDEGSDDRPVQRDGEFEVHRAYGTLRVLWIHAFTADKPVTPPTKAWKYAPDPPASTEPPRGRFVPHYWAEGYRRFGSPSLWGDIEYDLALLEHGFVSEAEIAYVYGMKTDALRWIIEHNWDLEAELVNAYAGMRQRVDEDHYQLMRTACQRASTAMERVVATKKAGVTIAPEFIHLYAFNGVRFHELLSALCADLDVLRSGRRVLDRPLPASSWRNTTSYHNGERVYAPHILELSHAG